MPGQSHSKLNPTHSDNVRVKATWWLSWWLH